MPPEKKLNLNLSPLWENPNNLFTLRFLDINAPLQRILAQRIKQVAPQQRIQREPNPDLIHSALKTINPIIFSEPTRENNRSYYHPFSRYSIHTIDGYYFKKLCQAIYQLTCRQTPLTNQEKRKIIVLTNRDYEQSRLFFEQHNLNYETQDQQSPPTYNEPITNESNEPNNTIDLHDIEQIRLITEQRNSTQHHTRQTPISIPPYIQ